MDRSDEDILLVRLAHFIEVKEYYKKNTEDFCLMLIADSRKELSNTQAAHREYLRRSNFDTTELEGQFMREWEAWANAADRWRLQIGVETK
jgi:hypothetical protein